MRTRSFFPPCFPSKERKDKTSVFSPRKKKQTIKCKRRVPTNARKIFISLRRVKATRLIFISISFVSVSLLYSRVFFRTETTRMTFTSATTFSSTTIWVCCFEKKPLTSVRIRRRINQRIRSEEKEDYLENNMNNNNSESSSQTLKLSVQDRLRMGKNAHKFRSVVCLGTSPRAVVTRVNEGSEVFVDGEAVFGLHDQYLPSELILQKSAFAVEMAVRKIRSTYFAATTWENRHYLVREERDPFGSVNLSIREAKLSERLRRRMENEQMSQLERMGRWFPILDV